MSLPTFPANRHDIISDDAVVLDIASSLSIADRLIDPRERNLTAITLLYPHHATHWLVFVRCEGYTDPADNGYSLYIFPKAIADRTFVEAVIRKTLIQLSAETGMAPFEVL